MLTQREGTVEAIRRLLAECIIPALDNERSPFRALLAPDSEAAARKRSTVPNVERHDFPELCFCISGVAEIWAGGECRRLERGNVLVVPAGVAHSTGVLHAVTMRPEDACSRLLWMGIFPYGAVINLCETLQGIHRSTPRQLFLERRIYPHIQDLIQELRRGDYNYALQRVS